MRPEKTQILLVGLIGTLLLIILGGLVIIFLLLYKARQRRNRLQQAELRSTYEQALLETQIEAQNQTLQRLGEELHDNVGQLLTVIKLHLFTLEEETSPALEPGTFKPTLDLLGQVIDSIRSLSRTLDSETVGVRNFEESLLLELERIRQLNRFTVTFGQTGDAKPLPGRSKVVLFRMAQEVLNNAMKHSGGTHLRVQIDYLTSGLRLMIADDGQGFVRLPEMAQTQHNFVGSGLRNLRRRAALLGGSFTIESGRGNGTQVLIEVPTEGH